jgi:branched-chain amino acid transport system permease protein
MRRRDLLELGFGVAVIAAVAVFGAFVDKGALRDGIIRLCAVGLFAMSLNVLVGYTGLLSFGHAMFFGLGAYAFCLLVKSGAMNIPWAILLALLITVAVATLVGSICVRTTRVYFSFITLAIGMLFYSTIVAWDSLTGGEQGLTGGIPRQPFAGIDLANPFQYLLANVVVFVASVLVLRRILNSPFGAALRLIRDNPQRCEFLGINVLRMKLIAFVIASTFAAMGGVLMSLYVSGAYPNFAYWTTSGEGLFMIMLGGVNVFLGPAFGAAILLVLETVVNAHTTHHGIVIGIAILLTAMGLRRGLLEFLVDRYRLARSARAQNAARTQHPLDIAAASTPVEPIGLAAGGRK